MVSGLVRRVSAAATFAEAAQTAVETISDVLSPSSVALAIFVPGVNASRVIAAGPRASIELEHMGIAETCMVANYPNRRGLTTFSENRSAYRETLGGSDRVVNRVSGNDRRDANGALWGKYQQSSVRAA